MPLDKMNMENYESGSDISKDLTELANSVDKNSKDKSNPESEEKALLDKKMTLSVNKVVCNFNDSKSVFNFFYELGGFTQQNIDAYIDLFNQKIGEPLILKEDLYKQLTDNILKHYETDLGDDSIHGFINILDGMISLGDIPLNFSKQSQSIEAKLFRMFTPRFDRETTLSNMPQPSVYRSTFLSELNGASKKYYDLLKQDQYWS